MNFTDKQKKAIDTIDKSLLVSAAAGSGKTGVLVERIKRIILSGNIKINEILVLTFTNAAAKEMKKRLMSSIKSELKKETDKAKIRFLKEQIFLGNSAYISTFHSFAIRMIREFFFEINVDPDFKICDEVKGEVLKKNAVKQLIDDGFENDEFIPEGSFRWFLDAYTDGRKEENLENEIIKAYKKFRALPNYFSWATDRIDNLVLKNKDFKDWEICEIIINKIINEIDEGVAFGEKAMSVLIECTKVKEKLSVEIYELKALKEYILNNRPDINFEGLFDIKWARLAAPKEEKEAYSEVKDEVDKLRKKYKEIIKNLDENYGSKEILQERIDEFNTSMEYTKYFVKLMEYFEKKYTAEKTKEKLLDFGDVEHFLSELLEKEHIRKAISSRFKYIFIDEYQDTNPLQESILKRIAKPGNIFKVGDVKQSIYGFRQAEPEIFLETAKEYKKNHEAFKEKSISELINLNLNFRSNRRTLDFVNLVFDNFMDGYDEAQRLAPGLSIEDKYDELPEVHLLKQALQISNDEGSNLKKITQREAEAIHVAEIIKDIIGSDFYDIKKGKVRPAEPKDVVILLRKAAGGIAETYYKALLMYGIEAHISSESGYFDTIEINLAISLLETINNFNVDIPLIATLHGTVFNFSSRELALIKAHGNMNKIKGSFYSILKSYGNNGEDLILKEKVKNAIRTLSDWRVRKDTMPPGEFVWRILVESGIYLYISTLPNPKKREANLELLISRAETYTEKGVTSLLGFIKYLQVLKNYKTKEEQSVIESEESNLVKIMTIHKSKGLEFPFVIVADLGANVEKEKRDRSMLKFDSKIGFGLEYINPEKKFKRETILREAIEYQKMIKERAESLRVLYVAMTRAKNKLILTGFDNEKSYINKIANLKSDKFLLKEEEIDFIKEEDERTFESKTHQGEAGEDAEIEKLVDEKLSYSYPYKDDFNRKFRYSVTELGKLGKTDKAVEKVNNKNKNVPDAAEVGTAYHRLMEFINFSRVINDDNKPDGAYIAESLEKLIERGAISPDAAKMIDLDNINKFFNCDIGRKAAIASKAGNLEKEKPFVLKTRLEERDVVVQGIIDCLFEIDGEIFLVDYKTNRRREKESIEQFKQRIKDTYKFQLDIYGEAVLKGRLNQNIIKYIFLMDTGDGIEI